MKAPTILIVHHDPMALDLYAGTYSTCLTPAPQVLTATNNADAVRICGKQTVDLLITNITRSAATFGPEQGDGLILLEKIKIQFPSLPVFMATGSVSSEQYQRALELGVDQWFALPEGMPDLIAAVASHFGLQINRS